MGLMDYLINGSEFNEPELPSSIIIVSDPTDENCMETLKYFYNRIMGKFEYNTNQVSFSSGLLESCQIMVVASKLDLLEAEDYEAEEGIIYKIKEFSRTNGIKFVGWSCQDRRGSEYLAELKKQLAN